MSLRPETLGINKPIGAPEPATDSKSSGQAVSLLMRSFRNAIIVRILSVLSADRTE
jgi:hypothetical protein